MNGAFDAARARTIKQMPLDNLYTHDRRVWGETVG